MVVTGALTVGIVTDVVVVVDVVHEAHDVVFEALLDVVVGVEVVPEGEVTVFVLEVVLPDVLFHLQSSSSSSSCSADAFGIDNFKS